MICGLSVFFPFYQDSRNFIYFVEQLVDSHIVVLRHLAGKRVVSSLRFSNIEIIIESYCLRPNYLFKPVIYLLVFLYSIDS